jgi:hypothetical protein
MDFVHYFCAERALTFLISTHSPTIATQVPGGNLCSVDRTGAATVAVRSPSRLESLVTIAIQAGVGGLVFVEDALAEALVREILRRGCASYRHVMEVVVSGNRDRVLGALGSVAPIRQRLPSVGVLDGDTRGTAHKDALFLPGEVRPELLLREAARAAPTKLAEFVQTPAPTVAAALAAAQGADDHDWPFALAERLGLPLPAMIAALIETWLDVPANAEAGKALFDEICKKVPIF